MNHDSRIISATGDFSNKKAKYTAVNDFLLIHREIVRKSGGGMHLPDNTPIVRNEGTIISIGPTVIGKYELGQTVTFIGQMEYPVDMDEDECICALREMNVTSVKG